MRLRAFVWTIGLIGMLGLTVAPAEAASVRFSGNLALDARHVGTGAPIYSALIQVVGSGLATTAGLDFSLPADAVGGAFFVNAPSASFPTTQTRGALSNLAGSFIQGISEVTGSMGLSGSWLVGLFTQPPLAELIYPLGSIGVGGSVTTTTPTPGLPTDVTIVGGAWTSGTVTQQFFALPPLTASGFDIRDANGLGVVRLVSPFYVTTSIGPDNPTVAGFAIIDLVFVPEPGTATLVAFGLSGFACARRRR